MERIEDWLGAHVAPPVIVACVGLLCAGLVCCGYLKGQIDAEEEHWRATQHHRIPPQMLPTTAKE